MSKQSEWAVLECTKCNEIFSVPSVVILQGGKNYKSLSCPYCDHRGEIDVDIKFISHQTMNCKIKEVTKWIVE